MNDFHRACVRYRCWAWCDVVDASISRLPTLAIRPRSGGAYTLATVALAWLIERMPVGMIYALWTGTAAVLLVVIERLYFGRSPSLAQLAGMAVTLAGITLLAIGMGA